ncbi:hypothetical protein LNTAR_07119 [Lentisphaera araneosa HTCC2155]|uniref:Glycoside hydrolase family 42 N-terminal domain-containing protein n=1 Tax=Lentisphaera araneosa HTCC2155 TaxID=313628 RepID=A6DMV9_9BACT|nr:hypothetical protein [Lentisphaera araneosa]EDM26995.1 hypothetical protein LNTAR_07119 [Lentisphaera araneosa HTCC2155]
MKKLCYIMAFAGFFLSINSTVATSLPRGVTSKTFADPPNEFRLIQYKLNSQKRMDYSQWGIGGYMAFFYRDLYKQGAQGLERIGPLVDAAHASGQPVWLADDWGYPSGMAGGRVVAENPDFEVRSLVMLTQKGSGQKPISWSLPKNLHDIVSATLYPLKKGAIDLGAGTQLTPKRKTVSGKGITGPWELRVFARYTRSKNVQAQSTMPQFGHTGRYPDLMNRKAMGRFIANMHEPILKQIKDPGSKVQGFYCNEPNLMQTAWQTNEQYACTPWNDDLPTLFKKMHGYDLMDILSYLFEGNGIEARRARIHYRQTVAELLTDSFSRQIKTWCNKRGIKSSGHFLLNDYLPQHVQGYGDMMKFVSEFDVPALDIPIPNPDQFMSFRYQQSRFFSSVTAWEKGKETLMLLDPIIGGYGRVRLTPDLPLLINSVNMASFHGVNSFSSYLKLSSSPNVQGYSKDEYRWLNEYTGRITQVLRGAHRDAGVALYYPIAMFQADLLASRDRWRVINMQHTKRQNAWDNTEKVLLNGDIEYMIVHPEGLAEANIEQGRMIIGHGHYHTLIMPQIDIIPLMVVKKLREFQQAGGKVIWVEMVPRLSENKHHENTVKKAMAGVKLTKLKQLSAAIPKSYSSDFNLSFSPGSKSLAIARFRQDGKPIYLLVNREQKPITASVAGKGRVSLLDPSSGKISSVRLPAKLPMAGIRSLLLIPN